MTNQPAPTDDPAPSVEDERAGSARHLDTSFLINALVPGTRETSNRGDFRRFERAGLKLIAD